MIGNRAVLDAVRDAIVLSDVDTGMIVEANRAAESLLGRSLAELRSLHHSQLQPPESAAAAARPFARTEQSPAVTEGVVVHKDGRRIPVEVTSSHVTGPDGRRMLVDVFRNITEQSASRESLRQSEERLRQVAECADEFIWEVDASGLYLYASPVIKQILGYSPDEVVGRMHFYDLFSPETQEETKAATFEMFARREKFRAFLSLNVTKDGRIVVLETSGLPILDGNGNLVGYRGAATDVTQRRNAERALHDSERQARAQAAELQAIIDAAPAGIFIAHDSECHHISGNRTAHVLVRQPPGSNLSKSALPGERPENFRILHDGVEIPAHELPLQWAARTGQAARNCDVTVVFEDGTSLDLLGNVEPILDKSGNPQGAVGVLSDITERKQAEQALRENQQRLVSIYNTLEDVIFHLAVESEGQFRVVSVNVAFLRLTGMSPESVIGKTVNEIIPEPSLTMALGKYRQAIAENAVVHWEETTDYPTGRLTVIVSVAPVFDNHGACTHLVGSVHDITDRKRDEAALRESEERFRILADNAPVMIWISGPDKLCTFFNEPWLDFTGRTMEQEAGDGWASGVHPDDLDRCLATYCSSFDARHNFQMEYRLRRADGEYRWLLDSGTPLYRKGEFTGFIGSCIDISRQKMIESRLRASEIQLKEAQRLTMSGSWELDIETLKAQWSDEAFRIFGLPNGNPVEYSTFMSYVHPKDRERVLGAKANAGIGPFEIEYRIIRPGGEVRTLRAILEAIRDNEGVTVRVAGATQDITEHVKALESLRESEARLKNAERLAQVGHWQWDVPAKRVSGSEEMYRIFGKSPDYIPTFEGFLEDLIPGDRERVARLIGDSLERKTGGSTEYQTVHPNGDLRTISCKWEVLTDEEGLPVRMFGTCQDITDSQRAQEEAFARQKLESVGTLANGIAHDFNNLLGAMLAQADLALVESAAGSRPEEELQRIRDMAMHGAEIVRQLMVYAGKESEGLELTDVSRLIKDMGDLLNVSVSKHVQLVTDLDMDLPSVRANAAQLRQVAMNLVTNASEAIGHRDGTIRLTTRRATVDRIAANSGGVAEGDYVQLEVSDTGAGMPPETQARVFDPFFTTKSGGRGLGLPVVQGIVRKLGGVVHLASEPGKGTTFQIWMPSMEPKAEPTGPVPRAGESVLRSPEATVLVVEDEDALRLPISKMLRKRGFEVLEAANGSVAIDILRANLGRIDVILLDMTIPGASCQEIVTEAAQSRPDLRVLLTSAYSEELVRTMMGALQTRGFIRKPFQLEKLVQTLRSVLSS